MSYFDRLPFLATAKVTAVALFGLGASVASAHALTVSVADLNSGNVLDFAHSEGNTTKSNASGSLSSTTGAGSLFVGGAYGGFTFTSSLGLETQYPPLASLLGDFAITSGSGDVEVTVTSSLFNVPADLPLVFDTDQTSNASGASSAVTSQVRFDGGDWMDLATLTGGLGVNSDVDVLTGAQPFQLRHIMRIEGSYQSPVDVDARTTVAPIPLPAAGWLLLTALGGLAVARRRRDKSAA